MRRIGVLALLLITAASMQACFKDQADQGHVPASYLSHREEIPVGKDAVIALEDRASITIPSDAIIEDVAVTIERNPDKFDQLPPLSDEFIQLGDFYNFIVEGGSLAGPVQLSLPFDENKIPEGEGGLVIAIPTADGWIYKPVTAADGLATWETLDVGDPVIGWAPWLEFETEFCDPIIDLQVTPVQGPSTTEFLFKGRLHPLDEDHWLYPNDDPELALDAVRGVTIWANVNGMDTEDWEASVTDENGDFYLWYTPSNDGFGFYEGDNILVVSAQCELTWVQDILGDSIYRTSWSQGITSFIIEGVDEEEQTTIEPELSLTSEATSTAEPTIGGTSSGDTLTGGQTQTSPQGVPAQKADSDWSYLGEIPCSQMNNYDWYWNEAGSGEYMSDQLFNGYRPLIYLPDAYNICPNFQLSAPPATSTAIPTDVPSAWCVPDANTACLYQYARDPSDPSANVSGVHVTFRYDSTSGPVFFDGYTNSSGWVRFPVTVGRYYHFEFDYGGGLSCSNSLDSIGAGGEFSGCRYPSAASGASSCLKGCPAASEPTSTPTPTPTPTPEPAVWCDPGTDTACMYLYARDPYDHSQGVPGVTVTYYYAGTNNVIYSGVTNADGWVRFGTPIRPVYYDRVLTGWPDGSSCSSYSNSVTEPGYYTANFYPLNPGGSGGCGKP